MKTNDGELTMPMRSRQQLQPPNNSNSKYPKVVTQEILRCRLGPIQAPSLQLNNVSPMSRGWKSKSMADFVRRPLGLF